MRSRLALSAHPILIALITITFVSSTSAFLLAQSTPANEFQKNRELAKQYLKEEAYSSAVPFLEKARAINGSDYDNGYDLAKSYLQTGQLDKARDEARQLLTIRNTADVHTLSGDIETAAHSPKPAAEEYQIAAHMDPSEDRIFDFGRSLLGFASDAAERVFSYGVQKYPRSAIMRIGLGEAYDIRGDYVKAIESLCQASDLNPDDPRPISFLGQLPVVPPDKTKMIDQRYSTFLKAHPDNAEASYYLGRDLLNPKDGTPSADDLNNSERLLQVAVHSNPKLAGAHFELGRLYAQRKKGTDAIGEYQKAIALDATQEEYHYQLAIAYRGAGEIDKANAEFQKFRSMRADKNEKYGPKDLTAPSGPAKDDTH